MNETTGRIDAARRALAEPEVRASVIGTFAAAALAASAAVLLAGVVILGPGVTIQDSARAVSAL